MDSKVHIDPYPVSNKAFPPMIKQTERETHIYQVTVGELSIFWQLWKKTTAHTIWGFLGVEC
jgi:hypothetical protein